MIEKRLACSILAVFYFCSAIFLTAAPLAAQAPVAHWKFDEGSGTVAFDSSGNGQSALLSNDVSWVNGARGWAISSSNANRGYVSTSPIDLSGTEAVTVAFWAKRTYTTSGGVLIEAGEGYQSPTTGFALLPDDDTCPGNSGCGARRPGHDRELLQPAFVWSLAPSCHGLRQESDRRQRNHVLRRWRLQRPTWNLASVTNTNNFGKNPLHLFSRANGSQFSSGTVKDLQVYNRALQSTEIQQLYSGPQQFTVTQGVGSVKATMPSWQSTASGRR